MLHQKAKESHTAQYRHFAKPYNDRLNAKSIYSALRLAPVSSSVSLYLTLHSSTQCLTNHPLCSELLARCITLARYQTCCDVHDRCHRHDVVCWAAMVSLDTRSSSIPATSFASRTSAESLLARRRDAMPTARCMLQS